MSGIVPAMVLEPTMVVSVRIVDSGFPWATVWTVAVGALAGVFGAFLGGWIQRRSAADLAEAQLQISAAADFLTAVWSIVQSTGLYMALPTSPDPEPLLAQAGHDQPSHDYAGCTESRRTRGS
jgi:hypothetical protein